MDIPREAVEAAAAANCTTFDPLEGHVEGECPHCDASRDLARMAAERALKAALPHIQAALLWELMEPSVGMLVASHRAWEASGGLAREHVWTAMWQAMLIEAAAEKAIPMEQAND